MGIQKLSRRLGTRLIFLLKSFYPLKGYGMLLLWGLSYPGGGLAQDYWKPVDGKEIVWDLTKEIRLPHKDNIEMSGRKVSAIIYYEIDSLRNLTVSRDVIFPQLRTYNKTNEPDWKKYRAYFRRNSTDDLAPAIQMGNQLLVPSKIDSVSISGKLRFYCTPVKSIQVTKTFYPSMENRFLVEQWDITNISKKNQTLFFKDINLIQEQQGYKGTYTHRVFSSTEDTITLAPDSTYSFPIYYGALLNEEESSDFDFEKAYQQREAFLDELHKKLQLNSPDPIINTLFYFSKIRAAESIFDSSMGLVHSPGGGNYYVGIWANDQIEYSGPFFPYLGYGKGVKAAFNAYQKFLENIPQSDTHIPYAFEVDGNFPMQHLDRGDAAMIAYGTSLYLLNAGNKEQIKKLWPLIEWSLEYCHKKRNTFGAIQSESDEMEGRIATGNANLSTSTLYYGGLKYAARLAKALGFSKAFKIYQKRAKAMENVIETYFGANMEGLETYKYFEENQLLRHWICLPLTMGITTRKNGTLTALFEKLWTPNGILVELNPAVPREEAIFWDRATLYALRGAMKVGAVPLAFEKWKSYSQNRLLGDHVPYAIEAFPENNRKHLSAESALYGRILMEGLLGMEPLSLTKLELTPRLPKEWDSLTLNKVYISGKPLDISISRKGESLVINIKKNGKPLLSKLVQEGATVILKH